MRTVRDHWYFSLALVPVLIGLLFLSLVVYWRDLDTAQENMRRTAKAMSLVVDREITHALNYTLAFAASADELGTGDAATLHRKALESLKAGDMADAMVMIDGTGRQIFNTLLPADAPLPHTNNVEELRRIFSTPKPRISDLFIGTVAKRPIVTVNVPVMRNGRITYGLSAVLFSARLSRILQEQKLPGDWYGVIFDRQGTIVARTHDPEKYVGKKVVPVLLAQLSGPQDGIYSTATLEGVPVTAAYARSDITGYGVAVGVPTAALMERLRNDLAAPMAGVLAAVLLSLGIAWRFDLVLRQRRIAQAAAREEQQRLYDMLETLPVYVALLNARRQVVFANRLFRDRFGAHGGSGSAALSLRNELFPLRHGGNVHGDHAVGTWDWQAPDGRQYAVYDRTFMDIEGQSLILEMGIDVTQERRAEHEQARLNRALRLVSECNSLLVHAKEEGPLLQAICNMVVDTGGYLMAWIGIAEDDANKSVRPVAQSGVEEGYLDSIRISWGDNEFGQGPTGKAIRTQAIQVNQNCLTNPAMAPWREAALKRGYQSSIALPLLDGAFPLGVLSIYSTEPEAFSPDEVALMDQLAKDLAFGLVAIRTEKARRQAVAGQRESEQRYASIITAMAEGMVLLARDGRIVAANPAACGILGRSEDQLLGRSTMDTHWEAVHEDESPWPGTEHPVMIALRTGQALRNQIMGIRAPDRGLRWISINAVPVFNDDGSSPDGVVATFIDITEQKDYEIQLQYQATHDPLTGLANRNLLVDRIGQSIVHARRSGRTVAVMLLDLDRFKLVNDSLGHEVGDALLQEVANTLSSRVRAGDTVARLGGDEFVVVFSEIADEDDTARLARMAIDAVSGTRHVAEHELVVTVSLGISMFPRDGQSVSELVRNADAAMYRAKELGGGSFQFYAPEMNARMLERLELETALRRALTQQEFELYYQPKVDLRHGHVVGAEALIRWRHPNAGLLPASHFIPLAEETGLVVPIGQWVIETACRQLRTWLDAGLDGMTMAVNVSARQFQQENLTETVAEALRSAGASAACLELEVTESAIMLNPQKATETLHALKKLGVRISLDDFGTGYSSLNYLKRFPIDSLKIDQSFVRDLISDPDDAAIVKLIIALGQNLGCKVIAEGVETIAQLSLLRRNRCDEMQGYLFTRPLSTSDFSALIRETPFLEMGDDLPEHANTLLLVDDEPNILASIKRLLRRDGYRILTAGSAEEGLELLARHSVKVIVSDQRMPGMSGTEFFRRVCQMYPDTVRILLTGFTDLESVTEAVNKGAILKFLTKPWEDDRLRGHVREAFWYYNARKPPDEESTA